MCTYVCSWKGSQGSNWTIVSMRNWIPCLLLLHSWLWFSVDSRVCNLSANTNFIFKISFVILSCLYCSTFYITSRNLNYLPFLLLLSAVVRREVLLSCITTTHVQFIWHLLQWNISFTPISTVFLEGYLFAPIVRRCNGLYSF